MDPRLGNGARHPALDGAVEGGHLIAKPEAGLWGLTQTFLGLQRF